MGVEAGFFVKGHHSYQLFYGEIPISPMVATLTKLGFLVNQCLFNHFDQVLNRKAGNNVVCGERNLIMNRIQISKLY